jgi:hypothetical protein
MASAELRHLLRLKRLPGLHRRSLRTSHYTSDVPGAVPSAEDGQPNLWGSSVPDVFSTPIADCFSLDDGPQHSDPRFCVDECPKLS